MGDRVGGVWDALAVIAVLAPVAGFAVGLAGTKLAWPVSTLTRVGGLAAAWLWAILLVAGAAPAVGNLDPDLLGMAAAAGTALLAAAVAEGIGPVPLAAGPLASALGAAATIADPSTSLARGSAAALIVAGGAVAAVCIATTGTARLAVVAAPVALLACLRGAAVLPDPPVALGVILAGLAAAAAWSWARRFPLPATVPLAVGTAALAAAPVDGARPAAPLLAAAVVLAAAVPAWRWLAAAAAPAVAVAAAAFADVPAPGGPNAAAHAVVALLLGAAVAGVVGAPTSPSSPVGPPARPVVVAVAALAAWLVVAPGSWRWAVPDRDALESWDSAAALAAAVGTLAVVAVVGAPGVDRFRRAGRQ